MRQRNMKQMLALAAFASLAFSGLTTHVAKGDVSALPLPNNAPDYLAGDYANGTNGSWAQGPLNFSNTYPLVVNSQVTDGDLSTYANSVNNNTADAAFGIFATPAAGFNYNNGISSPLGTISPISLIRVYGQLNASAVSGAPAFLNSYNIAPTQVAVDYGYKGGANTINNAYNMYAFNFAENATILAVNGVATGSDGGAVEISGAQWLANGVVPGTVNPSYPQDGIYYVDLTVAMPATNALFFDFGISPTRTTLSTGNGGILVDEIQAIPEPASIGLAAAGSIGLLARRRRHM